jgi:geranylgeranyl diphosphate synthase type II
VAQACGEPNAAITDAAATSIELMHCASLVHDDLPCFDNADTRRGKPSVHSAFGEPLAVLAGDALIILAYQALIKGLADCPQVLAPILEILSRAVGMSGGLIAGQAWESEVDIPLTAYHAAKTGSLFVAAAAAGAASAGHDPREWETFGARLGQAYQAADDIRDACSNAHDIGKPVGRDSALGRPSIVRQLGLVDAHAHLRRLVEEALAAIPPCPGGAELKAKVRTQVRRFVPSEAALVAA